MQVNLTHPVARGPAAATVDDVSPSTVELCGQERDYSPGVQSANPVCKVQTRFAKCKPGLQSANPVCKVQTRFAKCKPGLHRFAKCKPGLQSANPVCKVQTRFAKCKPGLQSANPVCKIWKVGREPVWYVCMYRSDKYVVTNTMSL
jgi:hypothetical protein